MRCRDPHSTATEAQKKSTAARRECKAVLSAHLANERRWRRDSRMVRPARRVFLPVSAFVVAQCLSELIECTREPTRAGVSHEHHVPYGAASGAWGNGLPSLCHVWWSVGVQQRDASILDERMGTGNEVVIALHTVSATT